MPELDGYETASLIRERDQTRGSRSSSGGGQQGTEHLMRGYAMGAVDYVFKPVDPLILKSKVGVFVDLYSMRVQVEETSRAEQQLRDANYQAELDRLQIARELQATREREAAIIHSLPMLLYMEPLAAEPRRPDFISGDMPALTGFEFDSTGRSVLVGAEAPSTTETSVGCLRRADIYRPFSIEYRGMRPMADTSISRPAVWSRWDDGHHRIEGTLPT